MLNQVSRHAAAKSPQSRSSRSASIESLLQTANRALDIADRVANIAAQSSGLNVADVLDAHAWPRLDEARKALEDAMSVAFEIVDEAAAKLDSIEPV
jgi:hypothetical protein